MGAVERIILDFSKPGEKVMEKIPGVQLLRKRKDRRDPKSAATERPAFDYYYHEQFMESFSQQATQSGMKTMLGLLKSGKLILRCANDWRDSM